MTTFTGGEKCGIYTERPGERDRFKCAWLGGILPSNYRPDRIGIVVYFRDSDQGEGICLDETRKGALDSPAGKAIAEMVKWRGKRLILRPQPD